MDGNMQDLFGVLREATGPGGTWYAVVVAAVVVLIRIYRRPEAQSFLPVRFQWARLSLVWRLLLVFLVSAGASWVTAVLTGQTLTGAALASVGVGLAAIAGHKVTKAAGHAQTASALRKGGSLYDPGSIRTALEPILPIDRKAIDVHRRVAEAARTAEKREA